MDINERIKTAVVAGVEAIPDAGEVFGLLIEELLAGSPEHDPWEDIKERVEQLVAQKISEQVYQQVSDSLDGLKVNSNEFVESLKSSQGNKQYISEKFNVAKGDFNQQRPHFQKKGYQLLLLPLFAQMANLHLELLREGCLHGTEWGFPDGAVQDIRAEITTTVQSYISYVQQVYDAGLADRVAHDVPGGVTDPNIYRFNQKYGFMREMRLSVLDYQQLWPYLDPSVYPDPVKPVIAGEMYSDAYGDTRQHGPVAAETLTWRRMTRARVWAGSKIDAVQVSYAGQDGPKVGGNGGTLSADLDLSKTGLITEYSVFPFDAVWGLGFGFKDGTAQKYGFYKHPDYRGQRPKPFSPPDGYDISGITVDGPDLARVIYFHFRYDNAADNATYTIRPGTTLPPGRRFPAGSGAAALVFQQDGDLVDYDENNVARFASQTQGAGGQRCMFTPEGQLVVYGHNDTILWQQPKTSCQHASLNIPSDGNIVIYDDTNGKALWATNTQH